MKSFTKKILAPFFAFSLIFICYLILFPNDFFLPKSEFINSPHFDYSHNVTRLIIYDKRKVSSGILALIKEPDKYLSASDNVLKDNHKRTITRLTIDSKDVFIKRFNYKNLYDWVTKCPFRSSKAYRSWFYAYELKKREIGTIDPIAIIEKRIGPFWTNTYLITEYVEGETLGCNFQSSNNLSHKSLSEKLTHILDVFYKLKWLHRDFIGQNILVTQDGVAIIDLDEMHSYAFNNSIFRKKFFGKHLAKLLKNIPPSSPFPDIFLMTHNDQSDYNSPEKPLENL